jgi:hypothetical protein
LTRGVRRAIGAAVAACIGFAAAFVIAFEIGLSRTSSAECDGVCFDKLDEVGLVAIGVGALCAIAAAIAAWRLLPRREGKAQGGASLD